jgi:hypothetical protein
MYEPASSDGFGALGIFVIIAIYFYFTYAQYKIAQKLGHSSPWWAFIPIVNTFQLIQMARREMYWFLFLLIPVVNIVCFAILWMDVARACNKSPFWGVMTLVPFINFVSIGVLAFAAATPPSSFPPHDHAQPREPERVG